MTFARILERYFGKHPEIYLTALQNSKNEGGDRFGEEARREWARHVMDLRRMLRVVGVGREFRAGWREV